MPSGAASRAFYMATLFAVVCRGTLLPPTFAVMPGVPIGNLVSVGCVHCGIVVLRIYVI